MHPVLRLCTALLVTVACASAGGPPTDSAGLHGDSRTITAADLANATQASLFDFVVTQRPQWLRGANGRPAPASVYVNDALFGGAVSLRDITLSQVASVRYFDVAAAQQRFNVRLDGPVIAVTLR